MFILHVALQGCLKGHGVEYGLTADTGGHIRYLLELVEASTQRDPGHRHVIATRRFSGIGPEYEIADEVCRPGVRILRLPTLSPGYVSKEDMHREVESFADGLVAWIEANGRPDIIHAHYADAGRAASIVRKRLGIPFVFTAHSLGRVKQAAFEAIDGGLPGMAERIEAEETALSDASLMIASSRDEAEVQYAMYRGYEPGRIRILPPGSDLAAFRDAVPTPGVEAEMARFLTDPSKPCLLAIARPVRRKNLTTLVEAFGRNAELRARANLVIVAGTRTDLAHCDAETSGVLAEILHLVDTYDLYGQAAYPKHHAPQDIPSYYAYAASQRGIFVNPALNEPFGLTLLEASAAGLPIIATDSGGPNDIVETCGNGILVDPRDADGIARAALAMLSDDARWHRYARSGASAADAYDWKSHVSRYDGLLRSILHPAGPHPRPTSLLVSDIDNTLVGCGDGLRAFRDWQCRQPGLAFGVATGRSFHSAMAIIEQENAPRPQVMITSVGSEIYHLASDGVSYMADTVWRRKVRRGWRREATIRAIEGIEGLTPQAPLEQRPFKLSYFSDGRTDTAATVRRRLEAAGIAASVVHSHGRYLDVLPHGVSKGSAVEFVRTSYRLPVNSVYVAGDSGNDVDMLGIMPQSIIVANYSDNLPGLPALAHAYVAQGTHARGIIEGVAHFRSNGGVGWKPAS
ncbi:HAD-IIB family hydrolase [Aureimonas sp. OT7]|uniref:HAD-IIB family hydrolase n=1 Tax=Aureimonas sp. OT7 TaxID=2816454 RepID=UPI00177C7BBB|nr:HAD-IIB family hydrolase [Aureimonas sp. OT7]QOG05379.1 HAD-IIB family hydrolase [Aureimonas sp. OT7]